MVREGVMSVVGLVESIAAMAVSDADQQQVERVLGEVRRVRGWLDSVEVSAARRLAELAAEAPSMFAERVLADAARVSLVEASKGFDRVATIETVPELGAVLESGDASAAHVDVLTRALRPLNPEQRRRLAERGEVFALAAAQLSCGEFARTVRNEVRRVSTDDGIDRLARQKRATSVRTWVDRDTGMWCLRGEFDPETGLRLDARLQAMVDTLFHDSTPDTAPSDPLLKQQHLRALALVALSEGRGRRGGTEINILIDAQTLLDGEHEHSVIDYGLDVDLPLETVRRMACCADVVVPVITASNGRSLHLGRDSRVANRDQRRALRAMYRGCAIPGCEARWQHCDIHHIIWYRHDGRTDIDNLLPLCWRHHHSAHEGGWQLGLDPHRNLTITYPDRTTTTTGPPTMRPG
jgi:Domain of unknown function (DUF222)